MAISQNGWVVRENSSGLVDFPWVTGRVLPGDVYTILNYVAKEFNSRVEPIRKDHSWGWAYRPIRGATAFSNHASATAVDFNAPSHPLGRTGTFSPAQIRTIHDILRPLDGVVRWGGDYPGRKDEMHFEINRPSAHVSAIAALINQGQIGPIGGIGGGGTAPTTPEEDDMTPEQDAALKVIFDNQTHINRRLDEIGSAAENARLEAQAAKNNTGPIKRGGVDVSLRQEIADTKTTVLGLVEAIWSYKPTGVSTMKDLIVVMKQRLVDGHAPTKPLTEFAEIKTLLEDK